MPFPFSNTNLIWTSILVETLHRLGLETAVICPGSRSAPLAIAFAQHPTIEAIPVLDERSAAFFALGIAQRSKKPTVLVCTSGTAGANFYPAVIEASISRVPLLILTADRPPELRDCNAGQAIDQQKLYGAYPNWYSELAIPMLDQELLTYLRQTIVQAWERTLYPVPGVVHLNMPFREPLAPIHQPEAEDFATRWSESEFFAAVASAPLRSLTPISYPVLPPDWWQLQRGIIIAGVAQPPCPYRYCEAITRLARTLQVPVLAEGLSPVRNYAHLNPDLISTYDLMLRDPDLADKLTPDFVIRIGEMPTSKVLRQWLQQTQPRQWVIDPGDRNLDPLHGQTTHLRISVEQLAISLPIQTEPESLSADHPYLHLWCASEHRRRRALDQTLDGLETLFEGKIAWMLSQYLPAETPIFIANSTPVRDVEWFWKPNVLQLRPFCNRGANGIDGLLSTALGVAHRQPSAVLLTGDLSFLHDTNGLLLREKFCGHLTIILINNNGGGIFELLPIAQFDPPFEAFFVTPMAINFEQLCAAYQIGYERVSSWDAFRQFLDPLPQQGIRVLEIQCDRKADANWRRKYFGQIEYSEEQSTNDEEQ